MEGIFTKLTDKTVHQLRIKVLDSYIYDQHNYLSQAFK